MDKTPATTNLAMFNEHMRAAKALARKLFGDDNDVADAIDDVEDMADVAAEAAFGDDVVIGAMSRAATSAAEWA